MPLVLNLDIDEPVFLQAIDGANKGPVFKHGPIRFAVIGMKGTKRFRVAITAPENVVIDLQPPDGVQVGAKRRE